MAEKKENIEELKKKAELLAETAAELGTEEAHIPKVIERFQKELAEMRAKLKS